MSIKFILIAFEQADGMLERFRRLLIEENTGGEGAFFIPPFRGLFGVPQREDRFQGAAFAVGNDRRAACLGLDRENAEIFLSSEDEGFGPLQVTF
jgi:hypothetical protein